MKKTPTEMTIITPSSRMLRASNLGQKSPEGKGYCSCLPPTMVPADQEPSPACHGHSRPRTLDQNSLEPKHMEAQGRSRSRPEPQIQVMRASTWKPREGPGQGLSTKPKSCAQAQVTQDGSRMTCPGQLAPTGRGTQTAGGRLARLICTVARRKEGPGAARQLIRVQGRQTTRPCREKSSLLGPRIPPAKAPYQQQMGHEEHELPRRDKLPASTFLQSCSFLCIGPWTRLQSLTKCSSKGQRCPFLRRIVRAPFHGSSF